MKVLNNKKQLIYNERDVDWKMSFVLMSYYVWWTGEGLVSFKTVRSVLKPDQIVMKSQDGVSVIFISTQCLHNIHFSESLVLCTVKLAVCGLASKASQSHKTGQILVTSQRAELVVKDHSVFALWHADIIGH